jgi:F-type H+-transporting ATPase subunit delta
MSRAAVARSYGCALFEAAREAGQLPQVLAEAEALESALKTELQGLLLSPRVPVASRLLIVREVFAGASELFLSFLTLVIRRGRAGALPEMIDVLRRQDHAAAGRAVGELSSAVALSPELKAEIRATMGRLTGTELSLVDRLDPELLGGFVARVGDQMLDLSLRTRLDQLRRQLKAV